MLYLFQYHIEFLSFNIVINTMYRFPFYIWYLHCIAFPHFFLGARSRCCSHLHRRLWVVSPLATTPSLGCLFISCPTTSSFPSCSSSPSRAGPHAPKLPSLFFRAPFRLRTTTLLSRLCSTKNSRTDLKYWHDLFLLWINLPPTSVTLSQPTLGFDSPTITTITNRSRALHRLSLPRLNIVASTLRRFPTLAPLMSLKNYSLSLRLFGRSFLWVSTCR